MIKEIVKNVGSFLNNIGSIGPVVCCFIIVLESIFPLLPLAVFITFNYWYFGPFIGFLLSWIFTIIGCTLAYYLVRKKFKKPLADKLFSHPKINKFLNIFTKLQFTSLVIIIAIPFTPAFVINIVAGISDVSFRKFFGSIMIGKIFLVLFWGYIGTSILESISNPLILIKIIILVIIAYVISKIANSKYHLD